MRRELSGEGGSELFGDKGNIWAGIEGELWGWYDERLSCDGDGLSTALPYGECDGLLTGEK
jgi:hypothetical protein